MIEIIDLKKRFGEVEVLKGLRANFVAGQNSLVIGQSGSGKTVWMKCLVGLLQPDEGQILYNGRDVVVMKESDRKEIRREIGMVFQGGALFDSMNVEENVMFPLDMFTNMSKEEKLERANSCLKRVDLENRNQLHPSELSGGMKKRVAIARAIVTNPKYLFFDEPTSGLDPKTANLIDVLINDITKEFNTTTVINTHDMNSVLQIGDVVNYIYEGQIWWTGNKNNIMESENNELRSFLGASELTKRLLK